MTGLKGIAGVAVGDHSSAAAIAVDSAGRFVVGGSHRVTSSSDYVFLLLRYNANGTLDPTFGTSGQVVTSFGTPYTDQMFSGLSLHDDGKIVAVGRGYIPTTPDDYDLLLARYDENGSLDPDFDGDDGKITYSLNASWVLPKDTILQADGKFSLEVVSERERVW